MVNSSLTKKLDTRSMKAIKASTVKDQHDSDRFCPQSPCHAINLGFLSQFWKPTKQNAKVSLWVGVGKGAVLLWHQSLDANDIILLVTYETHFYRQLHVPTYFLLERIQLTLGVGGKGLSAVY